MGGKEGAKGYIYQAIVATLDSLKDESWNSVSIEPDSEQDKIDICWIFDNNKQTVCQVKSSINNFRLADILKYLDELYQDINDAQEYKLVLIGPCSEDTKKFANSIKSKSKKDFEKHPHLFTIRKHLSVEIKTEDIELFEDAIKNKVNKFLSQKNIDLNYSTIELIAEGLMIQFLRFSTDGRNVLRKDFENKILEWVNYNYSNFFSSPKNTLEIQFYFSEFMPSSNELDMHLTLPNVNDYEDFIKEVEELKELIIKIEAINLAQTPNLKGFNPTPWNPNVISSSHLLPERLSQQEVDALTKKIRKCLNVSVSSELFNFGDLMVPQFRMVKKELDNSDFNGTKKEIKKRLLFEKFKHRLLDLDDLFSYWEQLQGFRIIPLILVNNGGVFNESIDVKISIPADVNLFCTKQFPTPNRLGTLKLLNSKFSFLKYSLKHWSDSNVKEFPILKTNSYYSPRLNFFKTLEEEISEEKEDFEYMLSNLSYYEIHSNIPDKKIFQCCIKEIKPNDKVSFPTFLFTKEAKGFDIEFDINSKHLPERIVGVISVKK